MFTASIYFCLLLIFFAKLFCSLRCNEQKALEAFHVRLKVSNEIFSRSRIILPNFARSKP